MLGAQQSPKWVLRLSVMAEDLATAFRAVVSVQLSSVTFVMDYWQLAFDGYGLTILTRIMVRGPNLRTSDGEPEFRNRLCDRIGHVVTDVALRPGDCLVLTFDDGSIIEASLRDQDYRGPEAILFRVRGSEKQCLDYIL
jgi:hypothetical protein